MTDDAVTVRPIEERDLPRYVPLRLEALKNHPAAFGSSYEDQCNDTPEAWLARLTNALAGEHTRLFVAEAADRNINFTRDIGCGVPCDFSAPGGSDIGPPFLQWDPDVGPAPSPARDWSPT